LVSSFMDLSDPYAFGRGKLSRLRGQSGGRAAGTLPITSLLGWGAVWMLRHSGKAVADPPDAEPGQDDSYAEEDRQLVRLESRASTATSPYPDFSPRCRTPVIGGRGGARFRC